MTQFVMSQGPVLPSDNPDIGPPLTRTFFVDQGSQEVEETGSIGQPFKTIQAVLDFIGEPVDAADQETTFEILVVGGTYLEDLVVPQNRQININTFSGVVTVNSVTWNQDSSLNPGTAIPFLALILNVAGAVDVSDSGAGAFFSGLLLISGNVSGDITITGYTATFFLLILNGALNQGGFGIGMNVNKIVSTPAVNQGILLEANNVNFIDTVDITAFGRILDSNIEADWLTVFTGFFPIGTPGFIDCFFGPITFTGDVDSFVVDAVSNYWAKTNGVVLGAPATKLIIADTTP